MKKFYMTIVAMLCGVAAMAQDVDGVYKQTQRCMPCRHS